MRVRVTGLEMCRRMQALPSPTESGMSWLYLRNRTTSTKEMVTYGMPSYMKICRSDGGKRSGLSEEAHSGHRWWWLGASDYVWRYIAQPLLLYVLWCSLNIGQFLWLWQLSKSQKLERSMYVCTMYVYSSRVQWIVSIYTQKVSKKTNPRGIEEWRMKQTS